MQCKTLFLADPTATEHLAQALARGCPKRAVIYLYGTLGTGKTTLTRAFLRALGVNGPIRSPTYTLIERYPLPARSDGTEAWHLDLYRIATADELDFLGLDEDSAALWLVEWPQHGLGALPAADLSIHLELKAQGRQAQLEAVTVIGQAWLEQCALPRFFMNF